MYKGGVVFVAGSAHLDVLAKITGDDAAVDKVGQVSIEIGGTACNIATNLAMLGLKPRLLTAMQADSPYSGIITSHLKSLGVDVHLVDHKDMPAAVFSAHIDRDGEMLSAVSSMPVEKAVFEEDAVLEAMKGARCVVMECNLSGATLDLLAKIALQLSIPVFVAAVSEEKSLRIMEIDAPLAGVFMNRRELTYFGRRIVASTSQRVVADRLGCSLIVTRDKEGVSIIGADSETHVDPAKISENAHTLGAGDALMASAVAHYVFGGLDLHHAVEEAVKFTVGIIAAGNCNAGEGRAIESALIKLDRMATRDTLTGLPNRRMGEQALQSVHAMAIQEGRPYSVILVDIDHFKLVNDRFGHDIGDEVIKMVASVLGQGVRENDVVCRWGGEEFLYVLGGVDQNIAGTVAERIRSAMESMDIPVAGRVTLSAGVATFSGEVDFDETVKRADQALYKAKGLGRNRVVFSEHG